MSKSFKQIQEELIEKNVSLVAVSKTKAIDEILDIYNQGQRLFGENRAKELQEKALQLPKDIEWHFIGHLQTNKVKYIIEHVSLIQSIDSLPLLEEVNKRAKSINKTVRVLLQLHIAEEENKYGFDWEDIEYLFDSESLQGLDNIKICGVMAMATFTDDEAKIRSEFRQCHDLFWDIKNTYQSENDQFLILSMGMSNDYDLAIEEGANMVRIGSLIFGSRN